MNNPESNSDLLNRNRTNGEHSSHWYLATAKPKQELRAIEHLENQGIDGYCPLVRVERLVRGKKTIKQEALFSGYIFVNLSEQDPNWHKVRSTRGIRDWVRFSDKVAKLPPELVNKLIDFSEDSDEQLLISRFKKGQSVRILTGPFAGLSAVYEKDDGEMRSMILIEFLGQSNRLKVNNEQIVVD